MHCAWHNTGCPAGRTLSSDPSLVPSLGGRSLASDQSMLYAGNTFAHNWSFFQKQGTVAIPLKVTLTWSFARKDISISADQSISKNKCTRILAHEPPPNKTFLLGVNLAPLHCHIWLHSGMVISGYTQEWWLTSSFGSMVNYLPPLQKRQHNLHTRKQPWGAEVEK